MSSSTISTPGGSSSQNTSTQKRERASAPKSRGGCVSCKRTHLKCDEAKPTCSRCTKLRLACEYKKPEKKPKARDIDRSVQRAILPKDASRELVIRSQSPSAESDASSSQTDVMPLVRSRNQEKWRLLEHMTGRQTTIPASIELWDCLSIDMPLKSKELFQYFYQADRAPQLLSGEQPKDSLMTIINEPYAFRSALLLAALHFAWNTGSLQSFEATFLVHKVHAIRTVDEWIAGRKFSLITAIIRQIATLCFAEVMGQSDDADDYIEQELADRYFIFTYTCFVGFRSRLEEYLRHNGSSETVYDMTPKMILSLTHAFQRSEIPTGGLWVKLAALRQLPSFFNPLPPGAKLNAIDGYDTICCLRDLTKELDKVRVQNLTEVETSKAVFERVWSNGAASKILVHYVFSHIRSVAPEDTSTDDTRERFMTTWCGMYIATNLYLNHGLDACKPHVMEQKTHRHMIYLFQRDLALFRTRLEQGSSTDRNFLFWQIFLGAMSSQDSPMTQFFNQGIRDWSKITSITQCSHASQKYKGFSASNLTATMGSAISSLWTPQKLLVGTVGLPQAGKTSIASKLKHNTIPVEWKPTYVVDLAENGDITVNGQPYNLFDYGGDVKFRPCWRSFLAKLDSILWVVDTGILEYKAVLVFANKQDSPKAMSVDEIIDELGLRHELKKKSARCQILPCSAATGEGLAKGLEWLVTTQKLIKIPNT
ncbi:hypothetical protein NM208_g4243 [Fusarium decemcellulare]|uniref:Uncharacterized protein n=1 Tax=Fusarium decemcellulare TaxID=57161 RepID=A0ACC1SLG1_9HYPO|nr:hypothetical protein NM208_g4243 [Fusarium decemcellulare]